MDVERGAGARWIAPGRNAKGMAACAAAISLVLLAAAGASGSPARAAGAPTSFGGFAEVAPAGMQKISKQFPGLASAAVTVDVRQRRVGVVAVLRSELPPSAKLQPLAKTSLIVEVGTIWDASATDPDGCDADLVVKLPMKTARYSVGPDRKTIVFASKLPRSFNAARAICFKAALMQPTVGRLQVVKQDATESRLLVGRVPEDGDLKARAEHATASEVDGLAGFRPRRVTSRCSRAVAPRTIRCRSRANYRNLFGSPASALIVATHTYATQAAGVTPPANDWLYLAWTRLADVRIKWRECPKSFSRGRRARRGCEFKTKLSTGEHLEDGFELVPSR